MGIFKRKNKEREPERPFISVVVAAAGSASRMMGEVNKILAPLGEMPVIGHCLLALENSRYVDETVVVARGEDILAIGDLCKALSISKVSKIVKGGESRVASVLIGLEEISPKARIAGIHDGARPLASPELIDRVLMAAVTYGAAVPGCPAADTLKMVSHDGCTAGTADREKIVAIQTPQAFDATLIRGALTQTLSEGWVITDDCSAVERLGMRVHVVPGESGNIKLTVPGDMLLAEGILYARNMSTC